MRLSEEEWASQRDKWTREAEDTTVEPELIFFFNGKTVPGPAGSDPLRCRKTGRFLQHGSFASLTEQPGGLLALPLADKQGAHVRTGELAWLDKNRFAVALDFFLAPRSRCAPLCPPHMAGRSCIQLARDDCGQSAHCLCARLKKRPPQLPPSTISVTGSGPNGFTASGTGRKRVILVGGTAYPWLSLDAVPVSLNASRRLLEEASQVGPPGWRYLETHPGPVTLSSDPTFSQVRLAWMARHHSPPGMSTLATHTTPSWSGRTAADPSPPAPRRPAACLQRPASAACRALSSTR